MLIKILCAILITVGSSAAQNSKGSWLTGPPADEFWNQLARSAYAQNGNDGLVIYMLSYSACPNCITFLRDFWEPRRGNIQLREIFIPINQARFLNEAADIALTRSSASADAYYHHSREAPPINGSPERQAALQKAVDITQKANALFRKLGHVQDSYPTFVFRVPAPEGGKLWIVSGFGPEFATDLDRWVRQTAAQ